MLILLGLNGGLGRRIRVVLILMLVLFLVFFVLFLFMEEFLLETAALEPCKFFKVVALESFKGEKDDELEEVKGGDILYVLDKYGFCVCC